MSKDSVRKSWEERINAFKQSGQSQSEWCRQNGLNLRSFNNWYNKLKKHSNSKPDSVSWLPINVVNKTPATSLKIIVGDAAIEVTEGFDPKLLTEVVKVLGAIC